MQGRPVLWPRGGGTRWSSVVFLDFFSFVCSPSRHLWGTVLGRGHGAQGRAWAREAGHLDSGSSVASAYHVTLQGLFPHV